MILAFFSIIVFSATFGAENIFWRGNPNKKMVCLTFDDGPDPEITPKILEILEKYKLKATFFVLGCNAGTFPELVRQVDQAGQDIGNHTYNHINFYRYPRPDREEKLSQEIDRTALVVKKNIGRLPRWVRMPYGCSKEWVRNLVAKKGYIFVTWTFGCDWNKMTAKELAENYLKNVENGAIFLLHDGRHHYTTVEALPLIIEGLQKEGYQIVTLQEIWESRKK